MYKNHETREYEKKEEDSLIESSKIFLTVN